MLRLLPTVRPYDWGSRGRISQFLGHPPTDEPEAELWLGAHAGWVTPAEGGSDLASVIAEDPERSLGARQVERFGPQLPFLMKVLAAGKPLSVQVHPDPAQARAGFAEEEHRGISPTDPARNYKDDQAKPEMMVAVEPMRALCGFRDPQRSRDALRELLGEPQHPVHAELDRALADSDPEVALRSALSVLLTGSAETAGFVDHLVAVARTSDQGGLAGEVASVLRLVADAHPEDQGIAVTVLLNHVGLAPGEAVFLGAGTMHAYLEGLGVEVMNNSDNVLRGGLTSKHVDPAELQRIVRFTPGPPHRVLGEETAPGCWTYRAPAAEFQLQQLEIGAGEQAPVAQNGPVVVLVADGVLDLVTDAGELTLRRGDSAFVPAAEHGLRARAAGVDVRLYAATTGA